MAAKRPKRRKQLFKKLPFGEKGKAMQMFLLTEILIILAVGVVGYFKFPIFIPVHYVNGVPSAYGQSWFFPLTAIILSIAPILVLIAVRLRYTLLNKYPYFINMPAFYYSELSRLKREKRSYWVNKYFELVLGVGASIGGLMMVTMFGIYEGTVSYYFPPEISLFMLAWIFATIVLLFYYLRDLYIQVQNKDKVKIKLARSTKK